MKIRVFIKKFFRKWFWKDLYYKYISTFLWPRQKWLTKKIPREYYDKDYLIVLILYEIIINYVESEECFKVIKWMQPEEKLVANKIKEIYKWAKTGRNKFLEKIDAAYPEIDIANITLPLKTNDKKTYKQLYGKVHQLENILKQKDDEYLKWIIENRTMLWS